MNSMFIVIYYLVIICTDIRSVVSRVLDSPASDLHITAELKLAHVIFRHGERTPADTYPKDIYINHTLYPYGWAQLTNNGKMNMYKIGQYLRERYEEFLGETYLPSTVYAQSTWPDRAHTSCALVLAGLWPPKGTPIEWNAQLNWTPIPIKSEPLDEDTLLLARKDCPRYFEELENVYKIPGVKAIVDRNAELFETLSQLTGSDIKTLEDIQDLYSTLDTEFRFGLKLPEWANEFYPDKLAVLTKESYIVNVYNNELKRLKGGPLLKKLINDWESVVESRMKPKERKLFIYSGHDSTVANILLTLGVWDKQIPEYGVMVIFELIKDLHTNEHGVEIYLRNSTEVPAYPLTIPGCKQRCPLQKLIELTKDVIPRNWAEECKAINPNYIPPLLGEP